MKKLFNLALLALTFLLTGTAFGQSSLPACIGSDKSRWSKCFGSWIAPNGNKYVGEWNAATYNGKGSYTFADGENYVGDFENGNYNGQGIARYTDGNKYVGEWKDGKRNGQGTYTFADGRILLGEWAVGKPSGRFIEYHADKTIKRSGIFKDGTLVTSQYIDPNSFARIARNKSAPAVSDSACQGTESSRWNNCFGSWTASNGDKYVGEFKDGKQDGQGTYYYLADNQFKGYKYVGEYKDGKRNGQGTFTYPDGEKYVGEYRDDQRNGQGTYSFVNGNKYVGEFRDGKYNGQGIIYSANGNIKESGIYKDWTLVTSQYIDPNSFTRLVKSNSSSSGTEAQRQENERKAAQLEVERKRIEEEKRQIALERQRTESQKGQVQVAPDNRRRLALVIGNDNYSSMPRLNNAVNDAKSMTDALRQANFEVMSYNNLDKRRMEEVLRNFTGKLGRDDVGLFYFSGHGIQADNRNFLIPVSENVKKTSEVPYEGIDVNRVMDNLKDAKNALNIVVLDACRSSLPDVRGGMSRGLTVTEAPQGSIVAYATAPGKTASDGEVGNSPFTKNLIRVMQRRGLKIEDVFKEVRVAVSRETNGEQVPQEVSQLVGDFYFRP